MACSQGHPGRRVLAWNVIKVGDKGNGGDRGKAEDADKAGARDAAKAGGRVRDKVGDADRDKVGDADKAGESASSRLARRNVNRQLPGLAR